MQLLQPRRLCTLVAATRHLHTLQVRHSPRLVQALCNSRLPTRQRRSGDRLLRRARGWHESALLTQDQRRFLSLRGGESEGRRLQDARHLCLEVDGLTCGSCVAKAERALLSVDGVLEVGEKHTACLWVACTSYSTARPHLHASFNAAAANTAGQSRDLGGVSARAPTRTGTESCLSRARYKVFMKETALSKRVENDSSASLAVAV